MHQFDAMAVHQGFADGQSTWIGAPLSKVHNDVFQFGFFVANIGMKCFDGANLFDHTETRHGPAYLFIAYIVVNARNKQGWFVVHANEYKWFIGLFVLFVILLLFLFFFLFFFLYSFSFFCMQIVIFF